MGKVHIAVEAAQGPSGYNAGRAAPTIKVEKARVKRALRAAIDVASGFGRGSGLLDAADDGEEAQRTGGGGRRARSLLLLRDGGTGGHDADDDVEGEGERELGELAVGLDD